MSLEERLAPPVAREEVMRAVGDGWGLAVEAVDLHELAMERIPDPFLTILDSQQEATLLTAEHCLRLFTSGLGLLFRGEAGAVPYLLRALNDASYLLYGCVYSVNFAWHVLEATDGNLPAKARKLLVNDLRRHDLHEAADDVDRQLKAIADSVNKLAHGHIQALRIEDADLLGTRKSIRRDMPVDQEARFLWSCLLELERNALMWLTVRKPPLLRGREYEHAIEIARDITEYVRPATPAVTNATNTTAPVERRPPK